MKKSAASASVDDDDDTEQDVKKAYYAVRRSAGGKMTERGEHERNRPPQLAPFQTSTIFIFRRRNSN